MKPLLIISAGFLIVTLMILVIRTLLHVPTRLEEIAQVSIELDEESLAEHLSQAIRFKTVSSQSRTDMQQDEFDGFIQWVAQTYPEVSTQLTLNQLNKSLLYKWQGSDPSLKPILVTAHYDVVPVIPGTEGKWEQQPFDGKIVDGIIWGRGALDDKSGVVGILEAATYLIKEGYKPIRTVYFSFGHDEEVGGRNGAGKVVEFLQDQSVQLAWSLDEGSFLFDGMFPGVKPLLASINVAEKGSLTLDVVATAPGGHSSMPPPETAVGKLARAITRLEENPIPGGLTDLTKEMFDAISAYMPFGQRLLFANQWLFARTIDSVLSKVTFTNAMVRTTTAPTMLSASVKTNVLPIEAIATVNFRIHPRDTMESIRQYVTKIVEDEDISVRVRGGRNASAVSDWNSDGYQLIARSVREVYGEVVIAPGLMIAGSDSRHYAKVADNSYRFNPYIMKSDDLTGFHGTNEKISVANFAQGVRSYVQIIRHGSDH